MGDVDRIIQKLERWVESAYKRWMDCASDTTEYIRLRYHLQYLERKKCLEIAKEGLQGSLDGDRWIPCTERLPKPEEEIEISVKRTRCGEEYYFSVRGFFEDGKVWNWDSNYLWYFSEDAVEWDDKREDYKIPEGWWECSSYSAEKNVNAIDDTVLAWRPLPDPYREPKMYRENNGKGNET